MTKKDALATNHTAKRGEVRVVRVRRASTPAKEVLCVTEPSPAAYKRAAGRFRRVPNRQHVLLVPAGEVERAQKVMRREGVTGTVIDTEGRTRYVGAVSGSLNLRHGEMRTAKGSHRSSR